jgi:hypothetical protein
MNTIDLTQRPPRSPRVPLGELVLLPRMLDKGRAQLAGKSGEYHFNCPLDQRLLKFLGLAAEDILGLLKEGKSDHEVLLWIQEHSKRTDFECYAWSQYQTQRTPADNESREYISDNITKLKTAREDIATWFDYLDVDDYVSFGGQA